LEPLDFLVFIVPPALWLGDMLLEASANASFRVILREEEGPSDDFAIALDDVSSVTAKSGGELVINVNLAYVGDVWIKRMGSPRICGTSTIA